MEELGDLLLQVLLHSEIGAEDGRFTLEDVAGRVADKLVRRHPHVFSGAPVPDDLDASWERSKREEKGRRSALEGISGRLSALSRTAKVVARARAHGVGVSFPDEPVTAAEAGAGIVALVARAHASGVDADQAVRAALRDLEDRVARAEGGVG